jgi:YfiH family protein
MSLGEPRLQRVTTGGITAWTDPEVRAAGVLIAFSERAGGLSAGPYASLNLARHVGDDPDVVDENRASLMGSLGIGHLADRIVTAEQVHGCDVAVVDRAADPERQVAGTDGLLTTCADLPLMLFFADCVPVIVVAAGHRTGVGVAHAGWRGAACGVHLAVSERLMRETGCVPQDLRVYIGPHIGPCHYEVGEEVLARFERTSATIAPAPGRLDLGAVVTTDLEGIGVPKDRVCHSQVCTAEDTSRFFSHRAEGLTGRQAAVAALISRAADA